MNTAILYLMVVSVMDTVMEVTVTAMNINTAMDTLMIMAMDTPMVRITVMVSNVHVIGHLNLHVVLGLGSQIQDFSPSCVVVICFKAGYEKGTWYLFYA